MNKQETIQRWATYIVPAVFRAEQQLLEEQPEWRDKLKNVENATQTAQEYCEAIATIIVENGGEIED